MVGLIGGPGADNEKALPIFSSLVGDKNSLRAQAVTGCVPAGVDAGHTDSWGVGWFDAVGRVSLLRQTGSAQDSAFYVFAAESATKEAAGSGPARTLLAHLRKASRGAVTSDNAHPVRADFRAGSGDAGKPYDTLLLAHNGTLYAPLLHSLRDDVMEAGRSAVA